jgi:hypothetical protein
MSRTMCELLDDLRQNGPVFMFMNWPQRNGEHVLYKRRVTAMTFDALTKRGLIHWTVSRKDGNLQRVYAANSDKAGL